MADWPPGGRFICHLVLDVLGERASTSLRFVLSNSRVRRREGLRCNLRSPTTFTLIAFTLTATRLIAFRDGSDGGRT